MAAPTFLDHLVTLLLGLGMPAAAVLGARRGGKAQVQGDASTRIATLWANGVFLLALGGVVLFTWHHSGRSFADLGLTGSGRSFAPAGLGLGLAVLVLYSLDVWWKTRNEAAREQTRSRWERDTPFMPRDSGATRNPMASWTVMGQHPAAA